MKDYKLAVYIGRFQPFHNAHLQVVEKGLEIADNVLVIIGSANAARTIKNPFTVKERMEMIGNATANMTHIRAVRDYYYNDNAWVSNIQSITDEFISEGDSVALLGSYKDGSSQYLKWFPQWDFITCNTDPISATDIREVLFNQTIAKDWQGKPSWWAGNPPYFANVPQETRDFLNSWVFTTEYTSLNKEYHFIKEYKKSWESAPFPPVFVTTDAVVVCSGHVLVVQRKFNPGKGLYALPGGFIKQSELIKTAAIRELKEETGIRIDRIILESSIVDSNVFDHPDRSLRGRTISHGFYFKLKDGKLPEVKGNDDASQALWMPIWDVNKNEDKFFEDHAHIINYFLGA